MSSPAQEAIAAALAQTALGNRQAFGQLYELTSAKLFAVVLRIVQDRAVAEEVLQECYVSVWQHASEYAAARSQPMTWLAAIVRNRALDWARRGRIATSELDDLLQETLADEAPTPDQRLSESAEAGRVTRCLGGLEGKERQAIGLAFYHGLSHSEVASHLAVPLGTIKSHIRRGLMKLKECLQA
jgi:RNA polymerase sigma-70 factor (ECF subfamily)